MAYLEEFQEPRRYPAKAVQIQDFLKCYLVVTPVALEQVINIQGYLQVPPCTLRVRALPTQHLISE